MNIISNYKIFCTHNYFLNVQSRTTVSFELPVNIFYDIKFVINMLSGKF